MADIIEWKPTPQAQNDAAAIGDALGGLLTARVVWNNPKSRFDAYIVGAKGHTDVPGEFHVLDAAKRECEKAVKSILMGATEETSAHNGIFLKAKGPGGLTLARIIPFAKSATPINDTVAHAKNTIESLVREIMGAEKR